MIKKTINYRAILIFLLIILLISFISAGIGIVSNAASLTVKENEESCITSIGAYNPFTTDSGVTISVSDELKGILIQKSVDTRLIPAGTGHDNAIPLKFCFKVPEVYHRDYAIAGRFIDKLDCTEGQKVYSGEVILESATTGDASSGMGSATKMAVSTPLNVRVACNPYGWNYSLVYTLAIFLSVSVIALILLRKYRKPKEERIKEKMKKLKQELKKK